jgi:hypothetical protein
MNQGFYGLSWYAWAGITLALTVLYIFLWPKQRAEGHTGFRFLIMRWGHALVWVLLTVNFILRGLSSSLAGAASIIALIALAMYIVFLVLTFAIN